MAGKCKTRINEDKSLKSQLSSDICQRVGESAAGSSASPAPHCICFAASTFGPKGKKRKGASAQAVALHAGLLIIRRNSVHSLRFLQIALYPELASPHEIMFALSKIIGTL